MLSRIAVWMSFRFLGTFNIPSSRFSAARKSGARPQKVFAQFGLTSSPPKSIHTLLMSVAGLPREWCLAMFGVCLVGIDAPQSPKDFCDLLVPFYRCPGESRHPHATRSINVPFLHVQYSRNYPPNPKPCYSVEPCKSLRPSRSAKVRDPAISIMLQ